MTGPNGNSKFCFLDTLNVSQGEAEGNTEIEEKQISLFPAGPVITSVLLLVSPNSKIEKNCKEIVWNTTWSLASRKFKLLFS